MTMVMIPTLSISEKITTQHCVVNTMLCYKKARNINFRQTNAHLGTMLVFNQKAKLLVTRPSAGVIFDKASVISETLNDGKQSTLVLFHTSTDENYNSQL